MIKYFKKKEIKIGVFDSGKGGQSVVNELKILAKILNLTIKTDFFQDTVNFPYGIKKKSHLEKIIWKNLEYLAQRGNRYIAIACNTASIAGQDIFYKAEKKLKIKIFPITLALANAYSDLFTIRKIMIIGTKFTIESGYYQNFIRRLNSQIEIVFQVEQELVIDIEKNYEKQVTKHLKRLNGNIRTNNCDGLFLGCTHFSLIKNLIEKKIPGIRIIDPAYCQAEEIIKEIIKKERKSLFL